MKSGCWPDNGAEARNATASSSQRADRIANMVFSWFILRSGLGWTGWKPILLRPHIVDPQRILLAQIQLAVDDDGMGPALAVAVGNLEDAGFLVAVRRGGNQRDIAVVV